MLVVGWNWTDSWKIKKWGYKIKIADSIFGNFIDASCMAAEKSCELAPCCARFRQILSAPINYMAEISYSLISQFCVDRIEIAHVSWPSRQWHSSFGVLEIRSSIALYWSLFLKSEQSSIRIYSEPVTRLFKWTEFRGNLWLELPSRSEGASSADQYDYR